MPKPDQRSAAWEKFIQGVNHGGADMALHAHMVKFILDKILKSARREAFLARKNAERFKLDCIVRQGKFVKRDVDDVPPWLDDLLRAVEIGDKVKNRLSTSLLGLVKITSHITWAEASDGAAKGVGMPGYDSAANVAKHARRTESAVAKRNTEALAGKKQKKHKRPKRRQMVAKGQGGLF